jgi:diguanylate cyclase (GGDEF)-like protein
LLAAAPLFQGVHFGELQAELQESRIQSIEPGYVLLDPKRLNTDIFLVLEGELMVCLEPSVDNPLVRLGAGDCVGELSIIDTSLPSAYVVASVATRLLAIPKAVLWRMMASQQALAVNLLHVLARRIRENNVVLLGSMERQREYRNRAETDALTGLHNRIWFEEVFPKQLELCERTSQHVALLMIDIDHFKKVNDAYGHQVGDEALRHLGQLLRCNLRATDLCARYGGEEMIVLMPGTDLVHAKVSAERLRQGIEEAVMPLSTGGELRLTVSGGLAQWIVGTRLSDLIRSADHALYRAKEQGRNCVVVNPIVVGL